MIKNLLINNNFCMSDPSFSEALVDAIFPSFVGEYVHFNVTKETGEAIRVILLGVFLGIFLGLVYYARLRLSYGRFVRYLLDNGATSREKAVTLKETGFYDKVAVHRDLQKGGALRLIVKCAEEETYYEAKKEEADGQKIKADYTRDLLTDRFYIPEDLVYRAELRFCKNELKAWTLPVAFCLCVGILSLLCHLMPQILSLIDGMLSLIL